MKRSTLAFAAALLAAGAISGPSHAWIAQVSAGGGVTTSQLMLGNSVGNLSGAAVRYLPLGYAGGAATASSIPNVFPVAGAFTALKFTTGTQPSGGASYTAVIFLNNTTASSATCNVTSSVAICDWTGSVAVSAGDYAEIRVTPNSGPSASLGYASVVFTPTTANETVIVSAARSAAFSTTATQGAVPMSGNVPAGVTAAARRHGILPDGGTLDRLYVNTNDPTNSSSSYAFSMLKNGANASPKPTCTVAAGSTTCNDTSNAFTNAAGDDIEFEGAPSGTAPVASNAAFGLRWVPTTAARFPLIMSTSAADSTTATNYYQLAGGNGVGSATEASVQNVSHSMSLEKMMVKVLTAPGSGKSRAFTLRKNGSDTGLTCTIADTATTCNITTTVTVADNDRLAISDVPTGTPAAAQVGVAFLATR